MKNKIEILKDKIKGRLKDLEMSRTETIRLSSRQAVDDIDLESEILKKTLYDIETIILNR